MYCKYCGKENINEAKFCKYCGRNIEPSFVLCPFCKKEVGKDMSECPYCFKVIREEISFKEETKSEVLGEKKEVVSEQKESLNYAGFWIRVGAFIIDYALLLILAFISGILFPFLYLALSSLKEEILGYIMIIIYSVFFLSIFSSTPGKMLYGLQVIDANTKEKIKFGKALVRGLSYIISSLVSGLGFLWIAIDRNKHQGWHDKIAKTLVIKKKKKSIIFPIILSVVAFGFSVWMIYSGEAGYDFSFLGREGATILNSIQERISQQPSGFCCSSLSPWEINQYLNEIPLKSLYIAEKNAEDIFEEFKEAIVTIGGETKDGKFGFGSGFLISPSGLIVTNYHVIEKMDKLAIAVLKSTTQLFDVNLIVAEDPEKDIAVLKIGGQNFSYIVMGDSDLMKVGQKVFAIGNPEGYTNTISEGIISQMREFESGIELFQITAPISQGSSGGALFNDKGEVIGITNMINWYGQNINFAIPINYVKDLLDISYSTENSIGDLTQCSSGCYFNGKCILNPPGSHCVTDDPNNAWKCNQGLIESDGLCINCSDAVCDTDYPGSKFSYYDKNSDSCVCDCPTGYEWNLGRTACVLHQKTTDEICKDFYGQNAYWDGTYCQCISGYVWNNNRNACITRTAACQETWQNTYWNGTFSSDGKYVCDCLTGYVWNNDNTACVTKASIDKLCQTKYGYSSYYLGYVEDGKYMCK